MFVRPFLKYFAPFAHRIVIAILGMIVVGVLTAVPILILREAINVFYNYNPNLVTQLELSGDLSPEMKSLSKSLLPSRPEKAPSEKAQAGSPGSKQAAGKDAAATDTLKRASSAKAWLLSHGGDAFRNAGLSVYASTLKPSVDRIHDWYREEERRDPLNALVILVGVMILLMVGKGAADFYSKFQLSYTFFFTNLQIREDIFSNVLRQDYLFFSRNSTGYLYSRISSDVKDLRGIIEDLLTDGIQQPVTLMVMFVLLIFFSWHLTLAVMVVLPAIGGLLFYFAKQLRKNARKQKKKTDDLSSRMTESLTNIRLVKAFGAEAIEIYKFRQRQLTLFRYMMARRVAKFGSGPLMEFLATVAMGGAILLGGWMTLSSPPKISFPDYAAFLFALRGFYKPIKNLADVTTKYQVAKVSADRMQEMLRLEPKLVDDPNPLPFKRLERDIEFRDIAFSYGKGRVLEGIKLRVKAGERVAFAGHSGSGKTTLINLLVRLIDPDEGQVLVDGIDLRSYKIADWRRSLAIVTQDTFLFDDTVANNIAYGADGLEGLIDGKHENGVVADYARAEAAARAANAHEFIKDLDGGKGYKTYIGPGGSRLSGGQRQRLAIARAIYRDPRILILDEATSALDSQSQALVQGALTRLMEGRTTFVVAHRISTIRSVDCIYMLDGGRIAESGTHQQLVAAGGFYAAMVSHAHGGIIDGAEDARDADGALLTAIEEFD